jgi:hypothetical protein
MSSFVNRSKVVTIAALSMMLALVGGSAQPTMAGRAAADEQPPLDMPHNVRFTGVQDVFSRNAIGDAIVITAVHGTAPTIAIGNTYRIDCAYTLASHDSATVSAYQTDTQPNLPHRQMIPGQFVRIEKGSGTFTVYLKVEDPGCPHVSFYPDGGGASFAGEYFGTGDSLPPASWLAKPQLAAR